MKNEDDLREWLKGVLAPAEVFRVEAAPGVTEGFPDLLVPVWRGYATGQRTVRPIVPGEREAREDRVPMPMSLLPMELKFGDWSRRGKVLRLGLRPTQVRYHRMAAILAIASCVLIAHRSPALGSLAVHLFDSRKITGPMMEGVAGISPLALGTLIWQDGESETLAHNRLASAMANCYVPG